MIDKTLENMTIRLASSRIKGIRLYRLFGFVDQQKTISSAKLTRLLEDLYESDKQDGILLRRLWDELRRLQDENEHLQVEIEKLKHSFK